MPIYDLGIKHSYVPHWDIWEGVREFVQNYLDGMEDHYGSQRGSLRHNGKELVLTNEDTELDRSAWILGQTSKAERSAQRGQWGDGLKTGSLALVRAGINVEMDNGSERWRPLVQESESFGGVTTLHIKIRKLRKSRDHFQARIGIDRETWEGLRRNFLPLCKNVAKIEVDGCGDILTGQSMESRIYARGIYVTTDPSLDYGYNFQDLALDRDRGTVSSWELTSEVASIERDALDAGSLSVADVYARLASGQTSLESLHSRLRYSNHKGDLYKGFAACFAQEHGSSAAPVANPGQATELSFVGKRGIVVPEVLGKVLEGHFGTFDEIRNDAVNDSGCEVSIGSLSDRDRAVVNRAVSILELADCVESSQLRSQLKVWAFDAKGAPLGLYLQDRIAPGVAEIRMNTSELTSLPQFLGTLIHEVAHDAGTDGTLAHRSKEEEIWQSVASVMLQFLGDDFID